MARTPSSTRTLIEAIKDPLTHLLRNAIDHGIERPEDRLRKGKPTEGVIRVRAYHEGGQVQIESATTGRHPLGQGPQQALARGLVTPQQLSAMSEEDLTNLIFLPGFSTAPQVTNVSGGAWDGRGEDQRREIGARWRWRPSSGREPPSASRSLSPWPSCRR